MASPGSPAVSGGVFAEFVRCSGILCEEVHHKLLASAAWAADPSLESAIFCGGKSQDFKPAHFFTYIFCFPLKSFQLWKHQQGVI